LGPKVILWNIRRIFGLNRADVAGGWRKLHNKQLHNVYSPSHTISVTESKCMKWARHVSRMGGMRNAYNVLVKNPNGRRYLEDTGVDGRRALKWSTEKG
jgi:hypothetical protein